MSLERGCGCFLPLQVNEKFFGPNKAFPSTLVEKTPPVLFQFNKGFIFFFITEYIKKKNTVKLTDQQGAHLVLRPEHASFMNLLFH